MSHWIRTLAIPVVAAATAAIGWLGASPALAAAADTEPEAITVTLGGGSAASEAPSGVAISGATVTITAPGTYRLTGSLDDGQVVVDSEIPGAVTLVLSGAAITNSTVSPLLVRAASAVNLTLAAGTANSLTDTSPSKAPPTQVELSAALLSAAKLTIGGGGSLAVKAASRQGIAGKDTITIASGTIDITSFEDGIKSASGVTIDGGSLTIASSNAAGVNVTNGISRQVNPLAITGGTIQVDAGRDCLAADNKITVTGGTSTLSCGANAIDGESNVSISGGTIIVTKCYEGIESESIAISGGDITIKASDDGLNGEDGALGEGFDGGVSVTISGGTLVVDSGKDGLDSNGDLTITGGTIVVNGPVTPARPSGAISVSGRCLVDGGTLLATGVYGGTKPNEKRVPGSASAQGFVEARFGARQAVGTVVQLADATGKVLVAFESSKLFDHVVYSSSELVPGLRYQVFVGGTVAGAGLAGMYPGGDLTNATLVNTVTAGGQKSGTPVTVG